FLAPHALDREIGALGIEIIGALLPERVQERLLGKELLPAPVQRLGIVVGHAENYPSETAERPRLRPRGAAAERRQAARMGRDRRLRAQGKPILTAPPGAARNNSPHC